MKVNIGTYSFGGIESYLGLGLTLKEKFQKIKFFSYLRNNEPEIKPVQLTDADTGIRKRINEDPQRIDLMDLDAMIVVVFGFMLYRDVEKPFIVYSGNSEDIDGPHEYSFRLQTVYRKKVL